MGRYGHQSNQAVSDVHLPTTLDGSNQNTSVLRSSHSWSTEDNGDIYLGAASLLVGEVAHAILVQFDSIRSVRVFDGVQNWQRTSFGTLGALEIAVGHTDCVETMVGFPLCSFLRLVSCALFVCHWYTDAAHVLFRIMHFADVRVTMLSCC